MPNGISKYAVIDWLSQCVPKTFRCTWESLAYLHDSPSTVYLPICFVNQNWLGNIMYLYQDIRGIAAVFAGLSLIFRCTRESWGYIHNRSSTAYVPIPVSNQNRLGDIENLCQKLRHGLTYSWQSRSFCWHIIEILEYLWSASQRVGSWDTAWGLLAQLQLSLPWFFWPMIEVHTQLRSSIQSRLRFVDMYKANFDKLWVIIDVSF
jgi:hypothetical protein